MTATDRRCAESVLRFDELLARCAGRLDFAERVIQKFLTHFSQDLESLEQAWDAGDWDSLTCTAHRMKGAAANIAAPGLHSLASEVEEAARQRRPELLSEVLPRLRDDWLPFSQTAATQDDLI